MEDVSGKIKRTIRKATPRAFKTIWWIFKITASVSFVMFMLKWAGIERGKPTIQFDKLMAVLTSLGIAVKLELP